MNLMFQELKKIWDPVIIVILLLFTLVYYALFSGFFIEYFANGPIAEEEFKLAKGWFKEYGSTIDEQEYKGLLTQLSREKEHFSDALKNVPAAAENGITTYDEYERMLDSTDDEDAAENAESGSAEIHYSRELDQQIRNGLDMTLLYRIQIMESTAEYLETRFQGKVLLPGDAGELRPAEVERLEELDRSELKFGYLPVGVLDSTTGLIIAVVIQIVIGVIILLSPTIVRDRLNRVQGLQYTTKTGRKILSVQFLAAILSGVVYGTATILFYGVLLFGKGVLDFRGFYLMSMGYIPWVNWTYGTYLLVIAGMAVVISVVASAFTVFLSRYSQNYIGMLLKSVILGTLLIFLFAMLPIITRPFFMFNPMSFNFHTGKIELVLLSVLFVCSLLPLGFSLLRQGRRELA